MASGEIFGVFCYKRMVLVNALPRTKRHNVPLHPPLITFCFQLTIFMRSVCKHVVMQLNTTKSNKSLIIQDTL